MEPVKAFTAWKSLETYHDPEPDPQPDDEPVDEPVEGGEDDGSA